MLSATWLVEKPHLCDGPFVGKYIFSQLHFHWGKTDMNGSEHYIDGGRFYFYCFFFKLLVYLFYLNAFIDTACQWNCTRCIIKVVTRLKQRLFVKMVELLF